MRRRGETTSRVYRATRVGLDVVVVVVIVVGAKSFSQRKENKEFSSFGYVTSRLYTYAQTLETGAIQPAISASSTLH